VAWSELHGVRNNQSTCEVACSHGAVSFLLEIIVMALPGVYKNRLMQAILSQNKGETAAHTWRATMIDCAHAFGSG